MTPYYADDSVTIYHGDCHALLPELDTTGMVIVTDPPYGIGWRQGGIRSSRIHDGIVGDDSTASRDAILASWGHRPAIWFGSWRQPVVGAKQALVYRKSADTGLVGSTTGYRNDWELIFLTGAWPKLTARWSGVLSTRISLAHPLGIKAIGHPHAKPLDVMVPFIERCPPGAILDPFAGAGSTLVAAKSLGRRAIGIEIEERYCEITAKRCSQEVLGLVG